MRITFAKQAAFKRSKPKGTNPAKRETPKYILPAGTSKSAADSAAAANLVIDDAITRITTGSSTTGESAPLSRPGKPVKGRKVSALRGLTFDEIVSAYLVWTPASS